MVPIFPGLSLVGERNSYQVIATQCLAAAVMGETQSRNLTESIRGGKVREGFQRKPGNPVLYWDRVKTQTPGKC